KRRVVRFKKGKKPSFRDDAGMLGFAGVSNQFFATIIAPEKPYDAWVWGNRKVVELPQLVGGGAGEAILMGMSLPEETLSVKGDNKESLTFNLYLGPKNNLLLRKTGEDYGKVMNYGMFGGISYVLNWLLNVLFSGIFSRMFDAWGWGFAIVTLTIIIRAAMWPLQNKSTRAMKRMSKLQPEMKELREKYADDPGRVNQEMMKMYREYGINPLGGCLPLLVQIPIFFGFYIMLQYAVELRQQPFLWVEDLALPDTVATLPFSLPFLGDGVNLLPTVMAVTMVLQMALTPKTGDKMQRRLFMMMPVIFFFFCYNFASALALYWTTSNIFAIVQMLITRRLPEPDLKKKKGAQKKGFFQRLQERAEVAQKTQKEMRAKQMGGPGPKKPKKRGPRTGG
ncbi:MAG: YidC/Oxa1 family insertase periplasmic-domain containing protein, partial [Verrucomicrobiota bacterium]|nr:YidC/Oxa1 family insertase periplasmic-domain containing protein [Verrucomicrobiota bacterium]